jgi:hypothetical protein
MATASFRDQHGAPREELYLAAPTGPLAWFDGEWLTFDAVVFDEYWEEVARLSEQVPIDGAPRGGDDRRVLVHQLETSLPPGTYQVATQVSGGDADGDGRHSLMSTRTEELEVEAFPPTGLAVSDLELAHRIGTTGSGAAGDGSTGASAGTFDKGGIAVIPNAPGIYVDDEPLVVYFEIYGLTLGEGRAQYDLRYRIRPADLEKGGLWASLKNALRNKSFIEAQVSEESLAESTRRYLAIDVSALEADEYQLTLTVTDRASGQRVKRQVRFETLQTRARAKSDANPEERGTLPGGGTPIEATPSDELR